MRPTRTALILATAALAAVAFLLGTRACGPGASTDTRTLVLFTIDTLRRDALGVYAADARARSVTPRLDALARAGTVFLDARTPVPLTLPAHVTMLSGLPPAATGVRLNAFGRLPDATGRGFPLLAERLRAEGWRTGAFVSAEPLAAQHGLEQGFEVYDDGAGVLAAESGYVPQRAGEETVARALTFLRGLEAQERAFLWVHIFEPHAPYARYADDVAAADLVAGRLLDGLAAAGRQDAAVLMTSDHGEMLDELGERTHGFLLGDGVLRVPFLLLLPGGAPQRRDDPVDLADVAPTLAGLAGLPWPAGGSAFAGRDLLAEPAPADRVRVAESLYAHHRMRWAQVTAATSRAGTLVERGLSRVGWLPAGADKPATLPEAAEPPTALVEALAAYKRGEIAARMAAAVESGPYGGGGPVAPFLSPEENARRPDPYRVIARARALDDLLRDVQRARAEAEQNRGSPRQASALVEQAARIAAEDPESPEAQFLHGRALELLALRRVMDGRVDEARAAALEAEAAYGRAFERGRADADTLALFAGVAAKDREPEMLARLDQLGRQVRWNARLWVLKARLHVGNNQPEAAAAACTQAAAAARTTSERELVTKACR